MEMMRTRAGSMPRLMSSLMVAMIVPPVASIGSEIIRRVPGANVSGSLFKYQ